VKRPLTYLAGTGRAAPAKVVTNHDFSALGIETSHDWIVERTGIHQRHIARNGETLCSIAADASRKAMAKAGVQAGELDAIVFATASPDRLLPSMAVDLQAELGASRAAAFDLGAACTGWAYAMTVAEGLIMNGTAQTVLVVGGEKLSGIINWKDRNTCILFGDGAGATILKKARPVTLPGHAKGILSTYMRSDGTLAELLWRPAGGGTIPVTPEVIADGSHFIQMAGREVFKHAVRSMSEAADRALDAAKLTAGDIDLLIPHQANIRIIEATAKHANIPMEKVFVNVDRYGNTSAASIPIALDEAIEQGRIKDGSLVLMVAFGAGFTWGSLVVRF
jgi:3-oxoacyl-[acyl-carrier-protein] synthase-3